MGIINSILQNPLDTPEWSAKRYPIFIPRSEVPALQMTSSKNLTQILCISLNEYLEELVWIFIACSEVLAFLGCAHIPEFIQNFSERQILWSWCLVDFHTLTLHLPIQILHFVVPELQLFVSSLENGANFRKTSTPQLYEMINPKQVSEIHYINLKESFEELACVFKHPIKLYSNIGKQWF